MEFIKVGLEEALSEGQLISVALDNGDSICLARVEGEVFALRDRCTHAEYPLSEGCLESGHQLECALHGAVFDVRDGSVIGPPAEQPVMTYEVKVEDGAIWVGVPTDG